MKRTFVAVASGYLLVTGAFAQGIPGRSGHPEGRAGWVALREGRHEAAARAFAAAIEAEPRDPSLRFGAGVAAHLVGESAGARDSLERVLRLAPDHTPAALLLGEILYTAGDLEEAIRLYEAALKYAPRHYRLARRLEAWRSETPLHGESYRQQSGPFAVLLDGPADEPLADQAIELLEAHYWRIGSTLSTFPEQPIRVILYTADPFRDDTRSLNGAAAGDAIRLPMRGALDHSEELERVLAHEVAHAFIRSIAPAGVPAWLNEGLAVFLEPDGLGWSYRQLGATNARLSHDRLSVGLEDRSAFRARLAYAQSAETVEKLVELGGTVAVVALLRDIARGETFAAAFERRMLMPYPSFIEELRTPGSALLR